MLIRWSLLSIQCLHTLALFPGRAPGEGDVRHLYPTTTIVIGLDDHAHMLPYLLGWLEGIDYPKKRVHLEIYLNGKEDSTPDQITWWQSSTKNIFASINVKSDVTNWMDDGMRAARLRQTNRVFILPGDALPQDEMILRNLNSNPKDVAVIPLLHAPPFRSVNNIEIEGFADRQREEREEVFTAALPVYINLEHTDASYLTFDAGNLMNYEGETDPLTVFAASAERMSLAVMADHSAFHGYWIDPELKLDEKRWAMRYLAADWVADRGIHAFVPSRSVRPYTPEAEKYGMDEIYLINLNRRRDRLEKIDKIFGILGIDYTHWEATDGNKLPKEYPFKILPGYLDPYHKRPMKAGEIGCFLSHYRIWEDVVARGLNQVIVFEDDVRFVSDGLQVLQETLEDIASKKQEWDLIYLGRKKNADQVELWIPGHRRLSTVGYSYWTLGYMLSATGARKLIEAKPLEKMIPVDEFLPLMFDRHPNAEWSEHYEIRDLNAFTVYPLVVVPQRYTHEDGYVSDTEESIIVSQDEQVDKDEL